MEEGAPRAEPGIVVAAERFLDAVRREGRAAHRLAAELDEHIGRREPAKLYAVVAILPVEERLVRQGRVGEIPGMRMLLVEIADAREKTADLRREIPGQRRRLNEGFLDIDAVVVLESDREIGEKRLVDIRLQVDFALADTDPAR